MELGDITKVKAPEEADLVVLDLPNPVEAIANAKNLAKQSGYIVFYTPHITQAQEVINALDDDFKFITTIEIIQRRWEIDEKRLRPKHNMLGHTAFLTIARKFAR